jgi:uridine kinase
MMNFSRIAETLGTKRFGADARRRLAGIGVRSAPTLKRAAQSPEGRARQNVMRNLAVLSRTPSSSLLATIRSAHPENALIVVGVDGPTGAGRATLCEEMRKLAGDVTVISASDFRRPIDRSMLAGLSSREVFEDCFDWQRLRREVLDPLSRGQRAVYRMSSGVGSGANSGAHSGEWVRVEPTGIILFEGVYTLRPELYPLYDYTVFVKPTQALPESGDAVQAAEAWYQDAYHPAAMADTLLEGDWF